MEGEERKISEFEFVLRAIKKLRKPPYKGIHSVYSGFNRAFREYFQKEPIETTMKLAEEGKIVTRPVKGGVMIYLPDEAPAPRGSENVLSKILEEDETPEKEGL
ncbi:MAG: hypothetical protein JW836_17330 [Deltaproteobacteria bacterium]|nr:hypothetical protein [Deltaproteobacteria bacterium]